jgi:hypothetical protein
MANSWVAQVGSESVSIGSLKELRAILFPTGAAAGQELWLVHPNGSRICMLRNRGRALLMFQDDDDETGLLARARDETPAAGTVEFTLANGQRDEYPAAWTVSAEQAAAALEHFFATAAMTPFLEWSDDEAA